MLTKFLICWKNSKMSQTFFYTIFILIISLYITSASKVCCSVDIKHERDFYKLRHCTIVRGSVRLSNVRIVNNSIISSSLEEISDYLIVYRVDGLNTLENIFPNLTIIRGHKLLIEKYSLVIYENRDLRNLGLKSLLKVRSGSILIESNPVLCFADTVNWIYLLENNSLQHYSIKSNRDPYECPPCSKTLNISESYYLKTSCWDLKNNQRRKPIPHLNKCPEECGINGCTKSQKCCSALCLTGCHAEECRICKNYRNPQGNCLESCNVPYYTLVDECVTETQCLERGLIPHAGSCLSECPKSYQLSFVNGLAQCNLLCEKNFTIHSKEDLKYLKDCVIIRGSVHIELKYVKSKIVAELENALGGIKEIFGSLKVTKSPQLVSLGFFKKLDTIKGEELLDGGISLYVVNNLHLEEIWPNNHKVALLKGRIFFHLNPRLCYEKILQLIPSIRNHDELGIKDASQNSNGERVICGNRLRTLNPIVEDINATAVRIKVAPLPSSDKEVVLGYLHYYKVAPVKNLTMFDGRHGCGRDSWQMDMTISRNVRHIINNLKPYTQYAFFVKTLSMVDYHLKMDWCSSIHYFRTSLMKPGPVSKIYSIGHSSTEIAVYWWPPKDANGVIDKYLLRYEAISQHINHTKIRGYISDAFKRKCDCRKYPNNRGPPPDDLNYYDRNQVIIDEAIPNFIFVSRRDDQKLLTDNTRYKRGSNSSENDVSILKITNSRNNSSNEQENIEHEKATELLFKKHLEEMEKKSFSEQDNGIEDFLISHAKPICSRVNPSKRFQKEQNCVELERYEGIEVSVKTHSFTLENLEPDVIYKISVRACIQGLENACGPEKSIEAETVSKNMEYFLKSP